MLSETGNSRTCSLQFGTTAPKLPAGFFTKLPPSWHGVVTQFAGLKSDRTKDVTAVWKTYGSLQQAHFVLKLLGTVVELACSAGRETVSIWFPLLVESCFSAHARVPDPGSWLPQHGYLDQSDT